MQNKPRLEGSPLPGRWLPALGLLVACLAGALALGSAGAAPLAAREGGAQAPAQATVTPGHIKVRGRIFFIGRNSDRNYPAAGLRVDILDKDERAFGSFELLDTTVADAQGFFESQEIPNVDPDGPSGQIDGTQDVVYRIYTDNGTVRVLEPATRRAYDWASYQIDEADGILRNVPDGVVGMPPLYIMENAADIEALWTFVNLVEGYMYLEGEIGRDPGQVTAFWSSTSQDGPRYDPEDRSIHLRDADAGFAHVVVQQEAYAFLHNAYGMLPGPWSGCTAGPQESVKSKAEDGCAFVQGLATFFPLAVYASPEFESLAVRALDLDLQGAGMPGWSDGDQVAGRIAGALWDLHEADTTVETYDKVNASFGDIWSVVLGRKPATMSSWWQGWLDAGLDGCSALGTLFQNTIDYNTPPVVSHLADVEMDEDTTLAIDLADYVRDAECPDEELTFALVDAGASEAGVHLVPTSVISITPQANWHGATLVKATVSDGPATLPIQFRLIVRSVNDCPAITPTVEAVQQRNGQPIVLELLRHGRDVEDEAYLLAWDVLLEDSDEADITVTGRGTTSLSLTLRPAVIVERNVRALLMVEDTEGCVTSQPLFLSWAARPNQPPTIWLDRLTREYVAIVNTDIQVDLTGVAADDEDGVDGLEWRVVNQLEKAGWGYPEPDTRQILYFRPAQDYVGSEVAELRVADTDGAQSPAPPVTVGITLTWVTRFEFENLPPYILKNKLLGKVVGPGASACYDLQDKAEDPDDPQSSLRWFVVDYDQSEVKVTGQGGRQLCLTPAAGRASFEGCLEHDFVVMDPKNAESAPHAVRTCWRSIRIAFPIVSKPHK